MTVTGLIRGHDAIWDGETWRWADGSPVDNRPCAECNVLPVPCDRGCPELHDPCLGHIDGIASACCGHGKFTGYVKWPHTENVREGWFRGVRVKQ